MVASSEVCVGKQSTNYNFLIAQLASRISFGLAAKIGDKMGHKTLLPITENCHNLGAFRRMADPIM